MSPWRPLAGHAGGNAAVQLLGGFLSQGVGFLAGLLLARALGPVDYGRFSLVQAYVGLFYIFSDLSMNNIIVRELSQRKHRQSEILFNSLLIKLALGFLTLGGYVAWSYLSPYDPSLRRLFFLAAPVVICNALMTVSVVYRTYLVMHVHTLISLTGRVLFLGGVLLAMGREAPLTWVVSAFSISVVFDLSLNFAFAGRWIPWRWAPDRALCAEILRETWPMVLFTIFVAGYLRLDPVFLSFFAGERSVGYYAVAYALFQVPMWVPNVLTTTYFPRLSERAMEGADELREGFGRLCKTMWPLACFGAAATVGGAGQFVRLFYGETFAGAVPPLRVMGLALVPAFMSYPAVFALMARRKQSLATWTFLGAAILSAGVNLALVPSQGALGAAVATLSRETWVLAATYFFLHRFLALPFPRLRTLLLPPLLAVLWGVALSALTGWPFGAVLVAGGLAVPAALYGARYWSADEKLWLKDSMPFLPGWAQ